MNQGDESRRQRAWSAYWSSGRLHSCAVGREDNYAGAIDSFWRDLFERITAVGRVLDVATGNGPLPKLLWEVGGAGVEVDAVDLAMLAPTWYDPGKHRAVRFHSGVRMEALPFADASFDCIISQFGFEYAHREDALAECMRVARPNATFAFVLHHADSVLVRVGREELAHHARLFGDDGLVAAARDVIPWISRARADTGISDSQSAAEARKRYNAALRNLADAASASPAPDLLLEAREMVHRLLASGSDEQSMANSLDRYGAALAGARLRTAEMVSHALDGSSLGQLVQLVRTSRPGIPVECVELRQAEGVVAWSLVAGPPASPDG